ncbi:hypothetical protein EYF80_060046 [Liparis tanakae]|uniref:Uncharacterized protein n=1 Tax=Liparis tanakae TaxID=230148 RepID=A0A4Z2ELN2_9TELE|nr:hypothetical protein EYF80_060046 [Liparis tanakae]
MPSLTAGRAPQVGPPVLMWLVVLSGPPLRPQAPQEGRVLGGRGVSSAEGACPVRTLWKH